MKGIGFRAFLCCVPLRTAHCFLSMSTSTKVSSSTLLGYREYIDKCDIVLASKSPRRKEILEYMGIGHRARVIVSTCEEDLDKASFATPGDYAVGTARLKAAEVAQQVLGDGASSNCVVIGADTIVEIDGKVLEKPLDAADAANMLASLSGRSHLVHTGVAVFTSHTGAKEPAALFYETTKVRFATLHDDEIQAYVATGEPMDKSGSYGIQGYGGQFVEGVEGCYFSVMGFPMSRFSQVMAELIQKGHVHI